MRLLILAGSGESRRLAEALRARPGLEPVVTLSRPMRGGPFPLPVRAGGFGGAEGFLAFLASEKPDAIIDATHPYAERITARTLALAGEAGLPVLVLSRPPWLPGPGDAWHDIAVPEETCDLIPPGACVFLGTGRAGLERFACLRGRRILCRQLDVADGPFPFEGGEFLLSHPPFTPEGEAALFRRLGVDWLVVKNAGGEGARPKLEAARALGLPVAMLRRPALPGGVARAETVEEALAWLDRL